MRRKAVAAGTLAAGAVGLGWLGRACWRSTTRALVARLRRELVPAPANSVDLTELDGLPAPAARYLRAVVPPGARPLRYARLTQRGGFRMGASWRRFAAVEHFTTWPPGFVWDARIRLLPGIAVLVRDGFVAGRGTMAASMVGLKTLARAEGTQAIAAGALQRYLAEAVWLPAALLPSHGVRWTGIDASSARAAIESGGIAVELEFRFRADGLVSGIYTPARERDLGGGRSEPTPWRGRFWDYAERGGFTIPMRGEVEWVLPEGAQPYWRGSIEAVAYE